MERLGAYLEKSIRKVMPDPFVLAVLLTFVTLLIAMVHQGDPQALLSGWKSYLFGPKKAGGGTQQAYLYFAFQMVLMLVTGHALAASPPFARMISSLSSLGKSPRSATLLVGFVAAFLGFLHWGLGLVGGALLAREVGRASREKGIPVHYPLLGAAGYLGLLTWGGGFSGSIPLKAQDHALPGGALIPESGFPGIPLSETLFSTTNLLVTGSLIVVAPILCALMIPADEESRVPFRDEGSVEQAAPEHFWTRRVAVGSLFTGVCVALFLSTVSVGLGASVFGGLLAGVIVGSLGHALLDPKAEDEGLDEERPLASGLERSRLLGWFLTLLGCGALFVEVFSGTFKLSFNNMNFAFLFLGIALHSNLSRYAAALSEGVRGAAGIVLQFPFYFGILGILVVSGLGAELARTVGEISNPTSYPVLTFLSAGLVNLFVPSGGGQWVVQGDIVIEGALRHGQDLLPKSILALAYGDEWTNMLQPFWALPLLAITGLRARDVMGYTAAVMLICGAMTITWLVVL